MSTDFPAARPRAGIGVYKAHGLGNDYLVVEEGDAWVMEGAAVERVCHRLEGVGSDGVVVLLRSEGPPFPLRMFNPDGGEFERSGNGLRVLASYLHRTGRVATGEAFAVSVGGDTVGMTVHGVEDDRYDVSVEMGVADVGPDAVALDGSALVPAGDGDGGADGRLAHPSDGAVPVHLVAVGNPHCVVHLDVLDRPLARDLLDRWGPWLTAHEAFARGTNVQLALVAERGREGGGVVDALVWERGAGHTTASGTSSCAVAVSAVRSGRLAPGRVRVRMEGGTLTVDVSRGLDVVLRGPVEAVFQGTMSPGFVGGLGGPR